MARQTIPFPDRPEDLKAAEKLMAEGNTLASIATGHFKVSVDVFSKWRKEHPHLEEAIRRGRYRDEKVCMDRLREIAFNDAHKQHLTALLAYGKIKHNWNDGSRLDTANVPALPKAVPVELDD